MKTPFPRRQLMLAASTLLATGCSAPEVIWVRPTLDVVPAAEGETWIFDDSGAHHPTEPEAPLPEGAGSLRAVAKDQQRGFGAALYDGALALVDIENDLVEWAGELPAAAAEGGPASLAFGPEALGLVCGMRAAVVDIPGCLPLQEFDLRDWLDSYGLTRANLFVPLGEGTFALVASRVPSAFTDGRVVIQAIDASRGAWRLLAGEGDLAGLDRIGAATASGGTIYVAGIVEQIARGAGTSRGSMHQSIVCFRFDPATSRSSPVVHENQIALDPRVLDLAAGRDPRSGRDLLAILGTGGDVRVYEVMSSGTTSAPVFTAPYPGAVSLAWLAPGRIAVATGDGTVHRIDVTGSELARPGDSQ